MSREQFLLDRKTGIGGSDIAAIMGVSPWRTAFDVYKDKTSDTIGEIDNDVLKRGRDLERTVLSAYADKTGKVLITNIPMMRDKEYPFLIGNIDARVKDENVIIEAKTTRSFMSSWHAGIPKHYQLQVAHYASITDADRVDIAVLFGGLDFGYFVYERDVELEKKIKRAAIDFWHNHILARVPPATQNLQDIKFEYPVVDGKKIIKADEDMRITVEALRDIEEKRKSLEKTEEDLKLRIQKYMGDAGVLEAGRYNAVLSCSEVERLDTKSFKVNHPGIYQDYLKKSERRSLKLIAS